MAASIQAARCKVCGKLHYPTHFYCPACHATEMEGVPIVGEGKLVTYTRVYALPLDYADLYITLGIVELDMGIRAMGRLDIAEPAIGQRVATHVGRVRETGGKAIKGLVFTAV
jgi:uncharacterized OB-fold protein